MPPLRVCSLSEAPCTSMTWSCSPSQVFLGQLRQVIFTRSAFYRSHEMMLALGNRAQRIPSRIYTLALRSKSSISTHLPKVTEAIAFCHLLFSAVTNQAAFASPCHIHVPGAVPPIPAHLLVTMRTEACRARCMSHRHIHKEFYLAFDNIIVHDVPLVYRQNLDYRGH